MNRPALIRPISIAGRLIGPGHPPFIIAEMSGNHNQSLARAHQIIDACAKAGVDAVKLQTYTADTMTLNLNKREFLIKNRKSLWKGQSLYRLYQKAYTPWEWHKSLFNHCRRRGLIAFSTPFDATAVDFLQRLRVPAFKIASFENVDLALIRRVAATGKPVIMSTGMASQKEVTEAVNAARLGGARSLVLLKCTSAYPAPAAESNLQLIPILRDRFKCLIGLSDHTLGNGASIASIALGAVVIERHVTLSRTDGGVDSAFSLEPQELKQLVQESRAAWKALGQAAYGPTRHERDLLIFRRSLYIVQDIKAGDRLSPDNLRAIRPGRGLAPKYLDRFMGKRVRRDIQRGTALRWEFIKE